MDHRPRVFSHFAPAELRDSPIEYSFDDKPDFFLAGTFRVTGNSRWKMTVEIEPATVAGAASPLFLLTHEDIDRIEFQSDAGCSAFICRDIPASQRAV